ncbi:MAG: restriction endonuclease subunit S [Sedimentisphaerales bacterium]|nr:restriction endonuclease subunit S [Sedimentisphaerales bacterium]
MKSGWPKEKLDDICYVEYGTRVVQKRDGGTAYPVYGGGGATFAMDIFNREDRVVIARFGMSEQCTRFVAGKFFLNDSGLTLSPKHPATLLPAFLNQWTFSVNDEIFELGKGTAQKNLDVTAFRCLQMPVPPLPEQKKIVSILDEVFEGIATAKANAEKNLQNARELFESYLQIVFANPKENWEIKKWGELCHFVRGPFGGSLKKTIFKEKGYAVYEQKHAIHDHFNQLRYFIDEEKFNEMIRFELKTGDIIMSCSGVTLGRVAIVPDGIPRGIINQALLKLTPNKDVSAHFLKHWLRSKIFQDIIFKYSGGAAIPNVPSAKILKDIKIPFPKIEEQNKIVNEIETVLNETKRLESIYQQKIADLEELKKSILQKAFNGELN